MKGKKAGVQPYVILVPFIFIFTYGICMEHLTFDLETGLTINTTIEEKDYKTEVTNIEPPSLLENYVVLFQEPSENGKKRFKLLHINRSVSVDCETDPVVNGGIVRNYYMPLDEVLKVYLCWR